MLNLTLIRLRLRQYGLVWLAAFALVLACALIAWKLARIDYIRAADMLLTGTLPVLGLILVGFVIHVLSRKQTPLTKAVLIIFALGLALPLLWAPVLGVIAGAWVADVSIEYSSAYAAFRITVGRLLYVVTEQVFGSPLVDAAWKTMQAFAGLVGFISAAVHSWRAVERVSEKPSA
ncbi:hypothetical protein [Phenylobacterium sp.]|uniref:hypothetical protein n=1 Tax=Phenylobacterium sp. TaxID=1871053 RepID=UPI00286DC2ED|nr:hypothetical protein [Phenylobacterium sp.]